MCDAAAEQRIARSLGIARVSVEVIARERRETLDIQSGDLALAGVKGISQLQIMKGDAERVAPPDPESGCRAPNDRRGQ